MGVRWCRSLPCSVSCRCRGARPGATSVWLTTATARSPSPGTSPSSSSVSHINGFLPASNILPSDPPSLQLERTEDSVEAMTISCSVVSRPPARVVLYRDSLDGEREVLYSSSEEEQEEKESVVTVRHHNEVALYSLHLQHLQLEDFGDYTCSADSPLGHTQDTTTVAGWPRVTSVKISSDPAQSSCYRVSVQLDSHYRVHNVHLLFRDARGLTKGQVNIPPSFNNFVSHRQCNLTFSTNYSVDISAANSYGASGPVEYNFTTETQNIFNLPWSAATRSDTSLPHSIWIGTLTNH